MNDLQMPDWESSITESGTDEATVTATYEKHPSTCLKCGSVGNLLNGVLLKFGSTKLTIADLPSYGKRITILVTRQRYRCRDCKATFVQPLPDIDEKGTMTRRLVQWIEKESLRRTFVDIAEQIGITEGTVSNVFHAYVKRLEGTVTFQTPRVLGIDELHLLGEPRCILTDITGRTIVGLLSKRTKDIVYRHLALMQGKERVQVVAMDMWNPYREAVRAALPNAVIVVDKYHVVSLADRAMEHVRKDLRASVTNKMGRELMRSRFILLKRSAKLSERDLLLRDVWLQQFPVLATAYRLKEAFHNIYEAQSQTEARRLYTEWQGLLTVEVTPEFKELTTAMANWADEVFAYFDHRVTNAYTEALNGIIKKANSMGRRYSFEVIRAKMLYVNAVHKIVSPVAVDRVAERKPFRFLHISDIHFSEGKAESLGVDMQRLEAFLDKLAGPARDTESTEIIITGDDAEMLKSTPLYE